MTAKSDPPETNPGHRADPVAKSGRNRLPLLFVAALAIFVLLIFGTNVWRDRQNDRMFDAIFRLDPVGLRNALAAGADPMATRTDARVPGLILRIKIILHIAPEPGTRHTPMQYLVDSLNGPLAGQVRPAGSLAEELLSNGVSVTSTDNSGEPLFVLACECMDIDTVQAFLRHGADPNMKAHGYTSLDWAAATYRADVVKLLLDHGANPFPSGANGQTTAQFTDEWYKAQKSLLSPQKVASHKEIERMLRARMAAMTVPPAN
jgi:hypothetical protein